MNSMYKNAVTEINPTHGEMIFCLFTPEMCEEQLKNNGINRSLSTVRINKYAKELESGYWVVNGENIKISDTGVLLDGQTRLKACVKTGIPFYSYVFVDAPEIVMGSIDTGKNRDNANFLQMRGYSYPRALGTAINIANCLSNSDVYVKQSIDIRTLCSSDDRDSGEWEIGFLKRINHINLHDSVVNCHRIKDLHGIKGDNFITPAKLAPIHYKIQAKYGVDIADGFIKKIYSDLNYVAGDPVNAMVRALKNNKADKFGRKMSTNGVDFRMAMKSWNSFVSGIKVKTSLTVRGIDKFFDVGDVSNVVDLYVDNAGILQRNIN